MAPLRDIDAAGSREPASWRFAKHAIQLAMAGAAVLLVIEGGAQPVMALSWAGAAFIGMCAMVIVDRQRFVEDGLALLELEMEQVEVIGPMHPPLTLAEPTPVYVQPVAAPFLATVT